MTAPNPTRIVTLAPDKPSLTADEFLEKARETNNGTRAWRSWKRTHGESIVELCNRADRMSILDLNFSGDFDLAYAVRQPVPRVPINGKLVVDELAVYHLHYEEQWLIEPPAPWWPLSLIQPFDPWHPNMRPSLRGAICLGTVGRAQNRAGGEHASDGTLAGVSPKEILMIGFFAVQLENIVLDERDPNGVLNKAACDYYRTFPEYLPLTRAGLCEPWEGWEGVDS